MHLHSLVLSLVFLPGESRRSIRMDYSHRDAQQQDNMIANGLEASVAAREALIPLGYRTGTSRHAAPWFRSHRPHAKAAQAANGPNFEDPYLGATRAGYPMMAVQERPEPSPKALAIGAAAAAGLLGVQLTGELTTGAVLAIVFAYGTTLSNEFGSATRSLGSACSKVYDKTLDLQEEYELIQKAKAAIDTTLTTADNLNQNYQITGKIAEKLKLSTAVDRARASVDDFRATASSKVEDFKSKAEDFKSKA